MLLGNTVSSTGGCAKVEQDEQKQALVGGTVEPTPKEQVKERHPSRCVKAGLCLWDLFLVLFIVLPLALFFIGAMRGVVSSTPPPVPPYLLRLVLRPYTNVLPEQYPAVARASQEPQYGNVEIPAEAAPYQVCLEPNASAYAGLPDADEVFDKIFARREFVKEEFGFNLLHCTLVNFFLEDFFRTVRGTNGSYVNRGTGLLSQVYGTSEARERALRAFKGGKMRLTEDQRLLHWVDLVQENPELGLRCHHMPGFEDETCLENSSAWYACGDERCNAHPGHLFWATVFARHHNFVCDTLAESHADMTDDELFEAARSVNRFAMFKIVWEEYVFRMSCGKTLCTVPFDPEVIRSMGFAEYLDKHPTLGFESMQLEFNQLYQWHHWIPDYIWWEEGGNFRTLLSDFMWEPDGFKKQSLQEWAEALHRTPMGHIQPRNYPRFMKGSYTKFLKYSRANHLAPYNKYREYFNLAPFTDFEQFEASPEVTAELRRLYSDDVNRVEFQVGLWADSAPDPLYKTLGLLHPLSDSLTRFVGTFALVNIANTPMVRDENWFTAENLKPAGFEYARAATLDALLANSGVQGLGNRPNEVPGSWEPPAFTTKIAHGLFTVLNFFR